jgi:hypothetical protein
LLFGDEDQDAKATRDPVAPAEPTADVKAKKATRETADGLEIHSFLTLLDGLGTQCCNTCEFGEERTLVCLTKVTEPTPLQTQAARLLEDYCRQQA